MMQPSAGSQAKPEPGKQFLDQYTADDGPFNRYINSAVQQLKNIRMPLPYQQTLNGAVGQALTDNPQNYSG